MTIQVPTPVQYNLKLSLDKSVVVDNLMVKSNDSYVSFLSNTVLPLNQMSDIEQIDDYTYTANVALWVLKQRKEEFNENNTAKQEDIDALLTF